MKKSLVLLFLSFIVVMALVSCGGSKSKATQAPTTAPTEAKTSAATEAPTQTDDGIWGDVEVDFDDLFNK